MLTEKHKKFIGFLGFIIFTIVAWTVITLLFSDCTPQNGNDEPISTDSTYIETDTTVVENSIIIDIDEDTTIIVVPDIEDTDSTETDTTEEVIKPAFPKSGVETQFSSSTKVITKKKR